MNYIEQAFEEALLAVGVSYPNPAVGAVVVKDGEIVGRGRTQVVHGPHAEVMALRDAGDRARGATLYVTLEPCCHYGRTPPCTKAIIEAGIEKVFFAHRDPNPLVFGKSEKVLAEAGICSKYFPPSAEFSQFYEAYDYFVQTGRTFVECKIAETSDGFIASSDKKPFRITGSEAGLWTAKWRRSAEYILVGGGTASADNPHLTVRGVSGNSPHRAVFCGNRPLSKTLRLFESPAEKTLVYSLSSQEEISGCADVRRLPSADFAENWKFVLNEFSRMGVHRLVVEPGRTLAQNILRTGLWNRFYVLHSERKSGAGLSWRTGLEPVTEVLGTFDGDTLLGAKNADLDPSK